MTTTILVSGSRWATQADHRDLIADHMAEFADFLDLADNEPIRIVHRDGPGEPGVDRLAELAARELGWTVERRRADWKECGEGCPPRPHRKVGKAGPYCPQAGPRGSRRMIDEFKADAAGMLALPEQGCDGRSGTWRAAHYAADVGLLVVVRALKVSVPGKSGGSR